MGETLSSAVPAQTRRGLSRDDALLIGGVTSGHAASHFLYQGFLVMLPAVRDALGINAIQVGAIMTARELASSLVAIPGGVLCDRLRRHWGLVLALCLAGFGAGWLIVSIAPSYGLVLVGMVLLAIAGSIWHLPAMAALSLRFSNRRGTALAIHGVGGNVGDVIGPILTGFLLAYASWRGVLGAYAFIPIVLAFFVGRTFQGVGRDQDAEGERERLSAREALASLKNSTLWRVNLVSGLRAMSYQVYTAFLPLYLADELGFDSKAIGFHIALVFAIGIVVTPAMGYLSDRVGRKSILIPMLIGSSVLTLILAFYGGGPWLAVILALLGVFLRSDYSLLSATVLDIVGKGAATTTLGVTSFVTFVMGAISPLIAGVLYERWGMTATLVYVAALFAVATLVFITVRLPRDVDEPAQSA